MSAQRLITEHLDLWTGAIAAKSSSGRGGSGKIELTGINKLRELILELAVRGKLVEQSPEDKPAQLMLERINQEVARQVSADQRKKPKPAAPISDDEVPFQIPNNWTWARLEALCELENGDRSKNYPNKSALVAAGIPFVNAGHIKNYEVNQEEMTFISEDRFNLLRSGKFREGDILFCLRGSLGKVGVVKGLIHGAIASSLIIARPIFQHSEYLLLYLRSPLSAEMVKQYDNGTAQPNLSGKDFGRFLVPVPPEEEQYRIVQKFDELMGLCDRLEQKTSDQLEAHETLVDTLLGTLTQSENATDLADNWARLATHFDTLFTTEQSIDKLKQTILQLAVMGRLVEQDESDGSARELLGQIEKRKAETKEGKTGKVKNSLSNNQSHVRPFGIPRNWEWAPLRDVGFTSTGKTPSTKECRFFSGSIPFLGPGQITNSGDITEPDKFLTEDGLAHSDEALPDDILAVCIGGSIGKTAKVKMRCAFNQQINKIRPVLVSSDYLHAALTADFFKAAVLAKATGSATPIINRSKWESIEIPLAPLAEQVRIVAKVNSLMALCDQLKECLNQASDTRCQLAVAIVQGALH